MLQNKIDKKTDTSINLDLLKMLPNKIVVEKKGGNYLEAWKRIESIFSAFKIMSRCNTHYRLTPVRFFKNNNADLQNECICTFCKVTYKNKVNNLSCKCKMSSETSSVHGKSRSIAACVALCMHAIVNNATNFSSHVNNLCFLSHLAVCRSYSFIVQQKKEVASVQHVNDMSPELINVIKKRSDKNKKMIMNTPLSMGSADLEELMHDLYVTSAISQIGIGKIGNGRRKRKRQSENGKKTKETDRDIFDQSDACNRANVCGSHKGIRTMSNAFRSTVPSLGDTDKTSRGTIIKSHVLDIQTLTRRKSKHNKTSKIDKNKTDLKLQHTCKVSYEKLRKELKVFQKQWQNKQNQKDKLSQQPQKTNNEFNLQKGNVLQRRFVSSLTINARRRPSNRARVSNAFHVKKVPQVKTCTVNNVIVKNKSSKVLSKLKSYKTAFFNTTLSRFIKKHKARPKPSCLLKKQTDKVQNIQKPLRREFIRRKSQLTNIVPGNIVKRHHANIRMASSVKTASLKKRAKCKGRENKLANDVTLNNVETTKDTLQNAGLQKFSKSVHDTSSSSSSSSSSSDTDSISSDNNSYDAKAHDRLGDTDNVSISSGDFDFMATGFG